jgi:hypothetical protein
MHQAELSSGWADSLLPQSIKPHPPDAWQFEHDSSIVVKRFRADAILVSRVL